MTQPRLSDLTVKQAAKLQWGTLLRYTAPDRDPIVGIKVPYEDPYVPDTLFGLFVPWYSSVTESFTGGPLDKDDRFEVITQAQFTRALNLAKRPARKMARRG